MTRPKHGGNLAWAAAIAGCPATDLTDFSASINPLGPPQSALTAVARATAKLNAYPDPDYTKLRAALAAHHNIDPEYILPGNGAAELLTWTGRELALQSITYLITPAFGDYQRALDCFGANITTCPLSIPPSSRLPIPSSSPIQQGLLLNNPHNPTGKLWTTAEISPYLEQFDLVVIDEAFMDFLTPSQEQSLIPLIEAYPNLVILRSLTKFYSLPGLRIGYAIAHPERLRRWQQWRDPWSVNILAAAAAEAILLDHEFRQQTWAWLAPARKNLFGGLRSITGIKPLPSAVNFLLVETDMPATELQTRLLQDYRLVIRDCISFPELGDRYFRVAVRLPADNARLIEAITAIV